MTIEEVVDAVAVAPDWDARIAAIRLVPERFGTAAHQDVYAAIAKRIYVPGLAPDFAYVHWRDDYEFEPLQHAFDRASSSTNGFVSVASSDLERTILAEPTTLRVFRLILGFTAQEFAAATALVAEAVGIKPISVGRVRSIEDGGVPTQKTAECCSRVVDLAMKRQLFGESPTEGVRLKTDKPDTKSGWETIQQYASQGVPLSVFLHQRLYGGAFRQLLDATSSKRGDILEDAVAELFTEHDIPSIRTGSHNQVEIADRFSITVKPAPDFVVFDGSGTMRAMLECKGANDGGTARDKAARFRALRVEAARLGGTPLFAFWRALGGPGHQTLLVRSCVKPTDGSSLFRRCRKC